MKILEAITHTDILKPNSYTQTEKVRWLSNLDGMIKTEIIDTHEGGEDIVFNGYNEETSLDTELIVPAPYVAVYIHYLEAQIDYANGELAKYNNSMQMFNTAYSNFERFYNRTHMPKGNKFQYF